MANLITTLGHDPVGMKRATERALGQISGEFDRVIAILNQMQEKLVELEARIAALEP